MQRAFRRTSWRDAMTPAKLPARGEWRLCGPAGVVAERVRLAAAPLRRARGLLGGPALDRGEVLLLVPCSQVHTIGMRYAIDAVFCDAGLTVLSAQTLDPGKLSRPVRGARCCLELPAGTAASAGIEPGVRLRFEGPVPTAVTE